MSQSTLFAGDSDPLTASEGKTWTHEGNNFRTHNVVAAQCHGSNVGPLGTLRRGSGNVTSGVPFVAHTLRAEGADASEDGSGRGTPLVVAKTLLGKANSSHAEDAETYVAQPTGFAVNQRREGRLQDVAGTVHAPSGTQVDGVLDPIPLQEVGGRQSKNQNGVGIGIGQASAPMYTLQAGQQHGVFIAVPRRLTPVECSRLQGFPDDWNECGVDEDNARVELSDSARYRQLGNAVSVPVAAYIGKLLLQQAEGGAMD